MDTEMTANDVLAMAEQIEADASDFYAQAASVCLDRRCAQTMLLLAAMESDHVAIFSTMRTHLGPEGLLAGPISADDTPGINLQLFRHLGSGVQADLAKRFKATDGPAEVLKTAIDFEKDTIVLLLTMQRMLPRSADRKRIDHVIKEEVGHVLLLTGQRFTSLQDAEA